jgi:hypothetical protein
MSAHGRSEALIPQRKARRVVRSAAHGRSEALIPEHAKPRGAR